MLGDASDTPLLKRLAASGDVRVALPAQTSLRRLAARETNSNWTFPAIDVYYKGLHAIPALSCATGSISLTCQPDNDNINLEALMSNGWPRDLTFILNKADSDIEKQAGVIWCHSDFIQTPYFYTHRLFESMKGKIIQIGRSGE